MQNFHYSIFITQFLSLITHHFKILHLFGTITQLPSLNIFHTVCRPYICHSVQLFSFFFYQYLETRKKKRPNPGEERKERKKKKSKKTQGRPNPGEKKKKKVDWSKGAAELWLVGPSCMFNYKNIIELWVTEI